MLLLLSLPLTMMMTLCLQLLLQRGMPLLLPLLPSFLQLLLLPLHVLPRLLLLVVLPRLTLFPQNSLVLLMVVVVALGRWQLLLGPRLAVSAFQVQPGIVIVVPVDIVLVPVHAPLSPAAVIYTKHPANTNTATATAAAAATPHPLTSTRPQGSSSVLSLNRRGRWCRFWCSGPRSVRRVMTKRALLAACRAC